MLNKTLINRFNMLYTNITNTTNTTASPLNKRDYCELPRKLSNDVSFAFLLTFIPITVIGNMLVIAVIASSKSLKKQTTFLFLASLAIADTLVGLVSMPFNARIQWKGGFLCLGDRACWTYNLEESFLSITSVIHLFVIGLDRYLSLRYVYQYNTLATKGRVKMAIAGIWGFSAFMALMIIFQWDDPSKIAIVSRRHICAAKNETFYTSVYVACFIIPLFLMIYMYAYVYKTASHHILEIAKMEVMDINHNKKSREKRRKKRQYRTLRSIVVVFVVYCICWYPTIFYILTIFHAKEFWQKQRKETWWKVFHFVLINFLPPLNSTTNPFIYVICNKQFRKVCKHLYYKFTDQEQRTMQFATTLVTEAHDLGLRYSSYNRDTAKGSSAKSMTVLSNSNTNLRRSEQAKLL